MSSGPGTDRLRANFMAGGCRNCFSSSGTPAVQHSRKEEKIGIKLGFTDGTDGVELEKERLMN